MTLIQNTLFAFAAAASALAGLVGAPSVFAAGDNTGELGAGGSARGDISTTSGETDRIGMNLIAGEPVDIKLRAGFGAALTLTDPMGAPVSLPFTDGSRTLNVKGWIAPASGRYEFRVSSFDGTQGAYSLTARAAWTRTISVPATGQMSLDVPMPAQSALRAAFKGTGVTLSQMTAPNAEVLLTALTGTARGLVVPKTSCVLAGTYRLDVSAATGTFTGTITRLLPRVRGTVLKLANGIDRVSFARDGIQAYFKARCANCHFWSGGYAGVRGYARESLTRMRSGNMPQNAPRASNETLSILDAWIRSGYGR